MYLNNNDFVVSGIAYDDEEGLQQLKNNCPDAAILDINLDGGSEGIEIATYIKEYVDIPFLFLTSYSDKETLERAKKTQPWSYIVKPFNEKALLASLEIAISNFALRSNNHIPTISQEKINRHLPSHLSDREFEVRQCIYDGKSNRQISETLFVSYNTNKKHINNAYLMLVVTSRSAAIVRLHELMMK